MDRSNAGGGERYESLLPLKQNGYRPAGLIDMWLRPAVAIEAAPPNRGCDQREPRICFGVV
jgi:hypothetical protein